MEHSTMTQDGRPTPVEASLVVLAKDVNQSIFNLLWLKKCGIVLDDEIDHTQWVMVPSLTSLPNKYYKLTVMPERIQVEIQLSELDGPTRAIRCMQSICSTLSHTPFTAIGLNFMYELEPSPADKFASWNLDRLSSKWSREVAPINPRTRFSSNVAYDAFDGARMRIRAMVAAKSETAADIADESEDIPYVVKLNCNLHRAVSSLGDKSHQELVRILSLWGKVKEHSDVIAKGLQS